MRYKNETQIFSSKNAIPDAGNKMGLKYASDETLSELGIYPIKETLYNSETHKLGDWVLIDGMYSQVEVPLTDVELDAKIPNRVSKLQLRLALIESGISINNIDDMIEAMPNGMDKERIMQLWNASTFYERNNPMLQGFAIELGLTTGQLNELFKTADLL